jgi:hypothetical protein
MDRELKVIAAVKRGQLKVASSQQIIDYVTNFPDDTEFEITIKRVKDARSLNLNRTYWMYLTMIGDHLGHSKMEMHDYFKAKFLCEIHIVNGEETLVCESTAKLSNKEFCEYLEKIFHYCADKIGFILPDIDEIKQIKREYT